MKHSEVVEAARCWSHLPFSRASFTEIGLPSGKRVDVLGYDPRGTIRIIECKATRADAKRLPEQLRRYRPYAHLLYVAAPLELAQELKGTLPKGVGLLGVRGNPPWGLSCKVLKVPRRHPVEERVMRQLHARVLAHLLAQYEVHLTCKRKLSGRR